MFHGVEGMPLLYVIAGVIMSVAFGFAAGNYACSLVHRLPRGRLMLDKKPYCGSCQTPLATKDLFPVVSALLLRHKCRYCGAEIPRTHFWTEVLIGLLFALCYLQFNFSQELILVAGLGIFWIVLASIHYNDKQLMPSMIASVAVFGMLTRTLIDGEIFPFLIGAFYGLLIGCVIWRKEIKPVNHVYSLPDGAKLLALAGLCLGSQGLAFGMVFLLVLTLLFKALELVKLTGRVPLSVPAGFAAVLPLLFPQVFSYSSLL